MCDFLCVCVGYICLRILVGQLTDEKLDVYVLDALGALTGDYYDDEDLGEYAGSSSSSISLGVILGAILGAIVVVALAIAGYSIYQKSSRSAKVGIDVAALHGVVSPSGAKATACLTLSNSAGSESGSEPRSRPKVAGSPVPSGPRTYHV
jgi:hypothetical protein